MSRRSQMVLARRSRASRPKSGFLNCISGARSAYLGMRRFRAAGTPRWGAAVAAAVSDGAVGASGLPVMVGCVIASSGRPRAVAAVLWSNHTVGDVVGPQQVLWVHAYAPAGPAVD